MTEKMVTTWAVLTLVTVLTRIGPLFAARWLQDRPWMDRIGSQLPCMILILLVFHDTDSRIASSNSSASITMLATIVGIGITLLMHRWKNQTILSITAGVATYAATSLMM